MPKKRTRTIGGRIYDYVGRKKNRREARIERKKVKNMSPKKSVLTTSNKDGSRDIWKSRRNL